MMSGMETGEYQILFETFWKFHEKYLSKKREIRKLAEETLVLRRDALMILAKANHLTRHLTGRQRHITGLTYHLGEIKARINQMTVFPGPSGEAGEKEIQGDFQTEIQPEFRPEFQEGRHDLRELRQKGLKLLGMIDNIRKSLLQLELLERRCHELIFAIRKAMEAFRHEWTTIRRKIYPFGFFSFLYRKFRCIWGRSYFCHNDMEHISALGVITGYVLKIADSPMI